MSSRDRRSGRDKDEESSGRDAKEKKLRVTLKGKKGELLARKKAEETTGRTFGSVSSKDSIGGLDDEVIALMRTRNEEKLGSDAIGKMTEERAAVAAKVADNFADFTKVRRDVDILDSARKHYDGSEIDKDFERRVVDSGGSLTKFITGAFAAATADHLDFKAPDARYRGQLCSFVLWLDRLWGSKYRGMTIMGGVYEDRIQVFHAGPGG